MDWAFYVAVVFAGLSVIVVVLLLVLFVSTFIIGNSRLDRKQLLDWIVFFFILGAVSFFGAWFFSPEKEERVSTEAILEQELTKETKLPSECEFKSNGLKVLAHKDSLEVINTGVKALNTEIMGYSYDKAFFWQTKLASGQGYLVNFYGGISLEKVMVGYGFGNLKQKIIDLSFCPKEVPNKSVKAE